MTVSAPRHIALLLWVAAAILLGVYCALMFNAGCAGDIKGGTAGDTSLALQLEERAIPFGMLSVFAALAAVISQRKLLPEQRIAVGIAVLLLGAVLFMYLGVQFEVWGVQSCHSISEGGQQ